MYYNWLPGWKYKGYATRTKNKKSRAICDFLVNSQHKPSFKDLKENFNLKKTVLTDKKSCDKTSFNDSIQIFLDYILWMKP